MTSQAAVPATRRRLLELLLLLLVLAIVSFVTLLVLDERFSPAVISFVDQITSSSTDQ